MLEISKSSTPVVPGAHEGDEDTDKIFVPYFSKAISNSFENVCAPAAVLLRLTICLPFRTTGSEHSAPLTAYVSVAFVNCGGSWLTSTVNARDNDVPSAFSNWSPALSAVLNRLSPR